MRGCARPGLPSRSAGFTHPNSTPSASALPDPCSASRPGPLRGSRAARASLDTCARLRLSVSMIVAAGSRPCGPASLSNNHGSVKAASDRRSHLKANAKHSSGRSDRSAAQEPRSGLTATGRCGRRLARGVRSVGTSPAMADRQFPERSAFQRAPPLSASGDVIHTTGDSAETRPAPHPTSPREGAGRGEERRHALLSPLAPDERFAFAAERLGDPDLFLDPNFIFLRKRKSC